jgi:hypothetical protein
LEEERQGALQQEEQRQQDRLDKEMQLKAILRDQMAELKQKEREVNINELLELSYIWF